MRFILMILFVAALAGCAGEPDEPEPMPEPEPEMEPEMLYVSQDVSTTGLYPANPGLSPAQITVARNTTLNITFYNEDPNSLVVHDLYFSGVDQQTPTIASGETAMLSFLVDLPPGEYEFWCAVGSHREQGMEGTLIVTE